MGLSKGYWLYAIEVNNPMCGRILVGPWYTDKAAAHSWVPFCKAAWHGLPTRVVRFSRERAIEIHGNGGQLRMAGGTTDGNVS